MSANDSLLLRTLEVLSRVNKRPYEVSWVGLRDGSKVMSWESFDALARLYKGTLELYPDLVIVGTNWWLELDSVTSTWRYQTIPVQQRRPEQLFRITPERKEDAPQSKSCPPQARST